MLEKIKQNSTLQFFKAFIRHPSAIGSIIPSSPNLAREIIKNIELDSSDTIIELGPGTGAFTNYIQQIIPETSAYIGIEREPRFVKMLHKCFPELLFVNGMAAKAQELFKETGRLPAKVIISSLPFSTQEKSDQIANIESINQLMLPGCMFKTIQYVHSYMFPSAIHFRRKMSELFGNHHRSQIIIKNVPPAYILTWTRE